MTGAIVLVGNRMVGIMALVLAAVVLLPVAEHLGPVRWGVALGSAVVGGALLGRRVELHPGEVRWRTGWRQRRCPATQLWSVEVDHRFLRFRPPGRRPVRMEVPAELRPEVRAWAAGAGRSATGGNAAG